jgi:hypothetical protein
VDKLRPQRHQLLRKTRAIPHGLEAFQLFLLRVVQEADLRLMEPVQQVQVQALPVLVELLWRELVEQQAMLEVREDRARAQEVREEQLKPEAITESLELLLVVAVREVEQPAIQHLLVVLVQLETSLLPGHVLV